MRVDRDKSNQTATQDGYVVLILYLGPGFAGGDVFPTESIIIL